MFYLWLWDLCEIHFELMKPSDKIYWPNGYDKTVALLSMSDNRINVYLGY
jgi:hypothetical protein